MPSGAANLALQNQLNTLTRNWRGGRQRLGWVAPRADRRGADGVARAAFTVLVERMHGPWSWASAVRRLANPHDVEDAFQATFLVLAKGRLGAQGRFGGQLAARRGASGRRSGQKRGRQTEQFEQREQRDEVEAIRVRGEQARCLARAPRKRSPAYRSTFATSVVLCYLEGLSGRAGRAAAWLPAGDHSFAAVASSRTAATPANPPRFCVSRSIRVGADFSSSASASDSTARHNRPRITGVVARSSTAMTLGSTALHRCLCKGSTTP